MRIPLSLSHARDFDISWLTVLGSAWSSRPHVNRSNPLGGVSGNNNTNNNTLYLYCTALTLPTWYDRFWYCRWYYTISKIIDIFRILIPGSQYVDKTRRYCWLVRDTKLCIYISLIQNPVISPRYISFSPPFFPHSHVIPMFVSELMLASHWLLLIELTTNYVRPTRNLTREPTHYR